MMVVIVIDVPSNTWIGVCLGTRGGGFHEAHMVALDRIESDKRSMMEQLTGENAVLKGELGSLRRKFDASTSRRKVQMMPSCRLASPKALGCHRDAL